MQGLINLANEHLSVRVSLQGGAVFDGHTSNGRPFLRGHDEALFDVLKSACFPMVPLCNRVENTEFEMDGKTHRFAPGYLHGDGWLNEWRVGDVSARYVRLVHSQSRPASSPHIYEAVQTIALEDATVTFTLSVANHGNETLPFGIGFHPYFPRTEDTRLEAPAAAWWTERDGCLPDVKEPIPDSADFTAPRRLPNYRLNNCFEGWNSQARIAWPETKLAATLSSDPVFSRYMLYAPQEDVSFFCLEPMSHTPNALVLAGPQAMHLLAPGETLSGTFSITVSDCEDFS